MYQIRYESRRSFARQSLNCIKNKTKNKIWRKTIFNMADGILTPCNVARSWHWFRQVTASCTVYVALKSWQWIHQVAAPCNVIRGSGMTCHWIRPNVCHIRILVSISTTLPQSTCYLFCTSLRNFIQIRQPSSEKNDVMSIFKTVDLSHLGF